eukprot:COSAG02_NODE_5952_length_3917_cov_2.449974_5_plen_123_part_00
MLYTTPSMHKTRRLTSQPVQNARGRVGLTMTEYGSRAFCLTAALTTFSTAFLMLFFFRYSCHRECGLLTNQPLPAEPPRSTMQQQQQSSSIAPRSRTWREREREKEKEKEKESARRPNGSFF